jgi:hypothetical protein
MYTTMSICIENTENPHFYIIISLYAFIIGRRETKRERNQTCADPAFYQERSDPVHLLKILVRGIFS